MKIYEHPVFKDIKIIEVFESEDKRGSFIKVFHDDTFKKCGLDFEIKEMYYSVSQKDVIRGMHFQSPPCDHAKLIQVPYGRAKDVVLDLRVNSITYGKFYESELSADNKRALYIPKGFAHGFSALEENTVMQYFVTSVYNKDADKGIRYDSFGYDWGISNAIVSERDSGFPTFEKFVSPFME